MPSPPVTFTCQCGIVCTRQKCNYDRSLTKFGIPLCGKCASTAGESRARQATINEIGNRYRCWEVIAAAAKAGRKASWQCQCRKCKTITITSGYNLRKGILPKHNCPIRTCGHCGRDETQVKFPKRFSICSECRKKYHLGYRAKNRAKLKQLNDNWRRANPERVKMMQARNRVAIQVPHRYLKMLVYQANRRAVGRASKHDRPVGIKWQHEKRCIESSPQAFISHLVGRKRRYVKALPRLLDKRAIQKAKRPEMHVMEITEEFIMDLWERQAGKCAVSGLEMTCILGDIKSVSIDRIDSSKGYISGNVQLVCRWVNLAKGRFTNAEITAVLDEFRAHTPELGTNHVEAM